MSSPDTEPSQVNKTILPMLKAYLKLCNACLKSSVTQPTVVPGHLRSTYFSRCEEDTGFAPTLCRGCFDALKEAHRFAEQCALAYRNIREMMADDTKQVITDNLATQHMHKVRKERLSLKQFIPNYYDVLIVDDTINDTFKDEDISTIDEPPSEPRSDEDPPELPNQQYSVDIDTDHLYTTWIESKEDINNDDYFNFESNSCIDKDDFDTITEQDEDDIPLKELFKVDDSEILVRDMLKDYFIVHKLTLDEQMEELLKQVETIRYKSASFKCDVCYNSYNSKSAYEVHMYQHSEIDIQEQTCWKLPYYLDPSLITSHPEYDAEMALRSAREHRAAGPLECRICHKRFPCYTKLWPHQRSHVWKYTCKQCGFECQSVLLSKNHIAYHSNGEVYNCRSCNRIYHRSSSYRRHLRAVHTDGNTVCLYCGLYFRNFRGLNMHYIKTRCNMDKTITEEGPWCVECQTQLYSEEALSTHLRVSPRHAGGKSKSRENFGKIAKEANRAKSFHDNIDREPSCDVNASKRRSHAMSHQGIQFKCNICHKVYKSYASLWLHRNIHTGRKYKCKICDKTFSTAGNRGKHMRTIHGNSPYVSCEYCEKSFKANDHLRQHISHVHFKKPWPRKRKLGSLSVAA